MDDRTGDDRRGRSSGGVPKAVLVDLDGTVFRSTEPITGAREGLDAIRSRGVEVLYVSNTSSKSRRECARRLRTVGVEASAADVLTAASATADHLDRAELDDAFVVGGRPLLDELRRVGVSTVDDPKSARVLVVGKDERFDYETLTNAYRALDAGTAFVATNCDRTSPTSAGLVPGTGALVGAVRGATGRPPDVVVGKPNEPLARAALDRLGVDPRDCWVVGDSVETDVAMGARAGMTTVLVLTGVTTRASLETAVDEPDHVVDSLAALPDLMGG